MKHIIVIILLLIACGDNVTIIYEAIPEVKIAISTDNQYVVEVAVYKPGDLLWYGALPCTVSAPMGDTLTCYFQAKVTNFASNHLQSNCIQESYGVYNCAELFVVDSLIWVVAQ